MRKISFALVAALSLTFFAPQVFAQEQQAYTVIIKYSERLTDTEEGRSVYSRTNQQHTTSVMAYNKREAEFKANEVKKNFESTCNCRIVSVEVQ